MKKSILYIIAGVAAICFSSACAKLDLNPPSEPSTESWNQNAQQLTLSLNNLYRRTFWTLEVNHTTDRRCDDWNQRDKDYYWCTDGVTADDGTIADFWEDSYKTIVRSNRVINSIEALGDREDLMVLKGEAYFFRAVGYGRLATHWGDVPYFTKDMTIEEALNTGRAKKDSVMALVYADFDKAIELLPDVNNQNSYSSTWRVTKGAARAMKARQALYNSDWKTCAGLCKDIRDSKVYSLYYSATNPEQSYAELAAAKGYTCETIFGIANSYVFDDGAITVTSYQPRTSGGFATAQPSWYLLASYEMYGNGKTIWDKDSGFDPKNPYANRDPRCCMTFVADGTEINGLIYNSNPTATKTIMDGIEVKNADIKPNDNYAAYNSCCLRKGVNPEWRSGEGGAAYNENMETIIRYGDVLLMLAEAKIELNEIDQDVFDAINSIRARAYGKQLTEGGYPKITATDQATLRKIIRRERHIELAWENTRWFDLKRWGLLEAVYSKTFMVGHPNADGLKKMYNNGDWFWPEVPPMEEINSVELPLFNSWEDKGYCVCNRRYVYNKRIEMFPIPSDDIRICPNLKQNPGY